MQDFYEYLESLKIIDGPSALSVVRSLDVKQLMDVLDDCFMYVNAGQLSLKPGSLFNFSVTGTLSGDIYPCAGIQCRLDVANRLSHFAALYADTVIVPHFFDYAYGHLGEHALPKNQAQLENVQNRVAGGMVVYLYYRPLIEAGIVQINPTIHLYCKDCLQRKLAEDQQLTDSIDGALDEILPYVNQKVRFSLDRDNSLLIHDPEGYFSPTHSINFGILPKELRKYVSRTPYFFSTREARKLDFLEIFRNPAIDDLIMQKLSVVSPNTSYLTDRKFDSLVLEQLHPSSYVPGSIPDAMEHALPFIENADLETMLKIRMNDYSAFEDYRSSIKKVMEQAIKKGTKDTQVVEAIHDLVDPELNHIQHVIDANKKILIADGKKKVIFNSMVFTAGYVAQHFLGHNASILKDVSIYKSKDIYGDYMKSRQTPFEAASNPYYFLWKVRNDA